MSIGNKKPCRLDEMLIARRLANDIQEASRLIRAGRVYVNEMVADKPGNRYRQDDAIRVKMPAAYVSRAGEKLAGSLDFFQIDPHGWCCADIGAATGGFTDCLLQRGAARVFAVDVAYGMLHWKLRTDPRVVVVERVNARHLTSSHIDCPLDLAVFDASFISLTKIIPPTIPFFGSTVRIVALIKPQFELPQAEVAKGGVVRDQQAQQNAILAVTSWAEEYGLACRGVVAASCKGRKGNQEYLLYLHRS